MMLDGEDVMDPRHASAVVLTKMALQDNKLTEAERDILEALCEGDGDLSVADLVADAMMHDLDELVEHVTLEADRFFVGLRARLMARADRNFDVQEEAFFKELLSHLELSEEHLEWLHDAEEALASGDELNANVQALLKQSSFTVSAPDAAINASRAHQVMSSLASWAKQR